MNNDSDYIHVEKYSSPPLTLSSKLDLHEINNINDGYNDSCNQNLTRFSHENVESDLVKLEEVLKNLQFIQLSMKMD